MSVLRQSKDTYIIVEKCRKSNAKNKERDLKIWGNIPPLFDPRHAHKKRPGKVSFL